MVFQKVVVEETLGILYGNWQTVIPFRGASLEISMISSMLMKKKGRTVRAPWLINGFRKAIQDAGLIDVSLEGYPFTWFKSLGTDRAVEERLDRALANEAWFHLFPSASLDNLVAPSSDHYPIFLTSAPSMRPTIGKKNFRFENAWKIEPTLVDVVKGSWQQHTCSDLVAKLEGCADDLKHWSKTHCNKLKVNIEECRRDLVRFRGTSDIGRYEGLQKRMTHLLVQEDLYWRQRAKTHWYQDGDLNTKFFHASATSRKKVNRISSLQTDDGVRVIDDIGLAKVAKDYFHELFQAKDSVRTPVLNALR
jgi:hypothetical protein